MVAPPWPQEKAGTTLSKIQPERMRDLIVDERRRVDPAPPHLSSPGSICWGAEEREGEDIFSLPSSIVFSDKLKDGLPWPAYRLQCSFEFMNL